MEKNEEHVKKIIYVNQMVVVSHFVQSRDHKVTENVEEHANRENCVSVTVFVD